MPHTLLLADDNPAIQRLLELTLSNEDILVVAVESGDAAIASLNRAAADIVLADVGLPIRSGYEVARHVKETPGLWHVPVLLLTGAFEPIDAVRAAESGCDGVLTKPLDPQVVIRRVRELLGTPTAIPEAPLAASVSLPPESEPTPVVEVVAERAEPPQSEAPPEEPTQESTWGDAFTSDAHVFQVQPARLDVVEPEPAPVESAGLWIAPPDSVDSERERLDWIRTEPILEHVETPPFELVMAEDAEVSEPESEPLAPAHTPAPSEVESYFEELDLAFSSLTIAPREPLPLSDRPRDESVPPAVSAPAPVSLASAFASLLAAETAPPEPEPTEPFEHPQAHELDVVEHAIPTTEAVSSPIPRWMMDETFHAMPALAEPAPAEHTPADHTPDEHPIARSPSSEDVAAAVVSELLRSPALSSDHLADRVTRLALERLPEDAVRAVVERAVSAAAERLIREEIERIKSNIK